MTSRVTRYPVSCVLLAILCTVFVVKLHGDPATVHQERILAFQAYTGITSKPLMVAYREADTNNSGYLSYNEVVSFQKRVVSRFIYRGNSTALRPDQFLVAGGGDCDDFALFTAGMLRYYGWEPYIGALDDGKSPYGHAVCLSYEESAKPAELSAYDIKAGSLVVGSKPGLYVPIDYEKVGGLSAVGPDWRLIRVYTPESMYGMRL